MDKINLKKKKRYCSLIGWPFNTGLIVCTFIQTVIYFEDSNKRGRLKINKERVITSDYGVILEGTADMSRFCYYYKKGSQELFSLHLHHILIHRE